MKGRLGLVLARLISLAATLELDSFPQLDLDGLASPDRPAHGRTFSDIVVELDLLDGEPYNFDISRAPLNENLREKATFGKEVLRLQGPNGDDYECYYPVKNAKSKELKPVDLVAPSPKETDDFDAKLQEKLLRLAPMKKACLIKQSGQWTYEFCHLKQIRQYSRAPNANPLHSILGERGSHIILRSGETMETLTEKEDQTAISDENLLGRFVPGQSSDRIVDGRLHQMYIDGDLCTHVGEDSKEIPRQTEVRFECSLAKPIDHIMEIAEISSCSYILKVGSPRLCSSSSALPNEERSIRCYPKKLVRTDSGRSEGGKAQTGSKKTRKKHYWRERLRDFLRRDYGVYPAITNILKEFMNDENIVIKLEAVEANQIPDRLLEKWLSIIDVKVDEDSRSASEDKEGQEGDNQNESSRSSEQPPPPKHEL